MKASPTPHLISALISIRTALFVLETDAKSAGGDWTARLVPEFAKAVHVREQKPGGSISGPRVCSEIHKYLDPQERGRVWRKLSSPRHSR